jgi:heme oxygenase
MFHTDEDDEFERIERENKMKGQPYHYKQRIELKSLTDEELQRALGVTAESSNWNMIMVLEWARKIEAAILEKNK